MLVFTLLRQLVTCISNVNKQHILCTYSLDLCNSRFLWRFCICACNLLLHSLFTEVSTFHVVFPEKFKQVKRTGCCHIVCFALLKNELIDTQPKLQMIKFLLRLHLAWLQATAYIVNNIAICEMATAGKLRRHDEDGINREKIRMVSWDLYKHAVMQLKLHYSQLLIFK